MFLVTRCQAELLIDDMSVVMEFLSVLFHFLCF